MSTLNIRLLFYSAGKHIEGFCAEIARAMVLAAYWVHFSFEQGEVFAGCGFLSRNFSEVSPQLILSAHA